MKICHVCLESKDLKFFKQRMKTNIKGEQYLYIETICKRCHATRNNTYNKTNPKTKENRQKYYLNNKDKELNNNKIYYRNRKRRDPVFKLRKDMSSRIAACLKQTGNFKNSSFLLYLPYTIEELKLHLESNFEWWMTWSNHGVYDSSTWDDNNSNTWTWQLDHIIPHSTLPYTSLQDVNFKICWSLENLRPLSAKQNILDGSSKIRHKI